MESLVLRNAPPLDPAWIQYYERLNPPCPKQKAYDSASALVRQAAYAQECRERHAAMMAPGARDHHLSKGITATPRTVTSSKDGAKIPVLVYTREEDEGKEPDVVIVYYHGGGLWVGEADSEELALRRLLLAGNYAIYSVGYRLMPEYSASVCVSDSFDAFQAIRGWVGSGGSSSSPRKLVIVGSSSGGELAALVSQMAPKHSFQGVLLRGPVTSDVFSGPEYVPAWLRPSHTSASDSFVTPLAGYMVRKVPRDGLGKMPLEATRDELVGMPRTWIQVCTNDVLYSDGVCYGMALEDAGVEVKADVVVGWPHTFWNKAPELPRALEADLAFIEGLKWVVSE